MFKNRILFILLFLASYVFSQDAEITFYPRGVRYEPSWRAELFVDDFDRIIEMQTKVFEGGSFIDSTSFDIDYSDGFAKITEYLQDGSFTNYRVIVQENPFRIFLSVGGIRQEVLMLEKQGVQINDSSLVLNEDGVIFNRVTRYGRIDGGFLFQRFSNSEYSITRSFIRADRIDHYNGEVSQDGIVVNQVPKYDDSYQIIWNGPKLNPAGALGNYVHLTLLAESNAIYLLPQFFEVGEIFE